MIENVKKSALASLCICIGCCVNIMCIHKGNAFAGAFLFSVGLLTICYYKFNLFTGKIGYVVYEKNFLEVFIILVCNLLFSYVTGLLCSLIIEVPVVEKMCEAKLLQKPVETLIKSFFCGVLMFVAVDLFKKNTRLGILMCVPVFILSGFEHCIANMVYFGMVKSTDFVPFLLLNIAGNTVGGITVPLLKKKED